MKEEREIVKKKNKKKRRRNEEWKEKKVEKDTEEVRKMTEEGSCRTACTHS